MPHIASTLGEASSALCAEDGGVKFGGMRHAALRESESTLQGGVPTHRRRQHHTVSFHLISHYVTASPGGEADCSLRPGEKVARRAG